VNTENIKYVRWRFNNKLQRQKEFKIFWKHLIKNEGQRVHEWEKIISQKRRSGIRQYAYIFKSDKQNVCKYWIPILWKGMLQETVQLPQR
jgi:hypothetical protein